MQDKGERLLFDFGCSVFESKSSLSLTYKKIQSQVFLSALFYEFVSARVH